MSTRVQGRPREEIDRRVQEAARLLKLEPFMRRTPLEASFDTEYP